MYNIFNVLRFVFMGALRGAGDTKIPMFIIIGTSWIMLAPGGFDNQNFTNGYSCRLDFSYSLCRFVGITDFMAL